MRRPTEPRVDRLHIDRRIRRILLFELVFVCLLYLLLFIVSNIFINQQNKVTSQILSRFQVNTQVDALERTIRANTNLVRSYRIDPNDQKFATIVKNHSQLGELLDGIKLRLEKTKVEEASQIGEEVVLADKLIQNYLAIITTSNSLIGRDVLSAVAAYRQAAKGQATVQTVETNQTAAELEAQLTKLEEESTAITDNWRVTVNQDIDRLKNKLAFSQQLRAITLFIQAVLVILGLGIISYTYVLPSFEKLFKQIITQNEELLRADNLKTEFISIASHQLRTPLSVIKWSLAILLKPTNKPEAKPLEPGQVDLLNQAKASVDTVVKLVGTLLNLSRIEQGRLEHHPKATDIVPIVQELVKDMGPLAAKRQISLTAECEEPKIDLMVDPLLFKEIIQNLVDNAITYNRPNGTVKIIVYRKDSSWHIDVADTGYGIAPEDLKNLFVKFFRGVNARTIRPNGSGLGLYFIQKIVLLHHGKITVESEPNQGSVFSVRFPVYTAKADQAVAKTTSPEGQLEDKLAQAIPPPPDSQPPPAIPDQSALPPVAPIQSVPSAPPPNITTPPPATPGPAPQTV